jgi:hypothetical protein
MTPREKFTVSSTKDTEVETNGVFSNLRHVQSHTHRPMMCSSWQHMLVLLYSHVVTQFTWFFLSLHLLLLCRSRYCFYQWWRSRLSGKWSPLTDDYLRQNQSWYLIEHLPEGHRLDIFHDRVCRCACWLKISPGSSTLMSTHLWKEVRDETVDHKHDDGHIP